MIVAPILAIISYFTVDYYVAEVPHKAKQGQSYKMLVKPNCRWASKWVKSGLLMIVPIYAKVSIIKVPYK
jgi:hypothetical protein